MALVQKSIKIIIGFAAFLMLANASISTAFAANVTIRTGEHDKYSRIVLEWNESFSHTIAKPSGTEIKLTFKKAAETETSGMANPAKSNLRNIDITATSPLALSLTIPKGSKHRVLKAGRKLILDVYSPATGKPTNTAQKSKAEKQEQERDQEKIKFVKKNPPSQNDLKDSGDAKQDAVGHVTGQLPKEIRVDTVAEKQYKPLSSLKKITALTDTNMITVSATKSMGMAVFESDGYLWMVVDKEDLFIRPQAAGSKADELKNTEKIKIKGGQAFRVPLPGQSKVTTDGEGLLWRIKLSPLHEESTTRTHAKPALPKNIAGISGRAGGKIFWPIRGALSVMDVLDPRTGEVLKAVSVRESKSYAGAPRRFAEFDVLASYAGITIRPKVDDLQIKIVQGGIEITRPRGLHILPQELVSTVLPRHHKKEESEEDQTTIFDFEEWEMGGVEALDENRSKALGALPEMEEGERLEKLITLGKMYLANGLGAEALGFFNFAQIELPELVQNPRFLAMRGVAKSINWKSEDGFNDLLRSGLDKYDDVAYWKAFTLADLSDWAQAGEVLPENIQPIYRYPAAIRNRLALGLAEVALRAGDIEKSQELLDMLDDDIEGLNTPQAAALKYLKGESARQNNDLAKTYEYWEELIEGDDDLYRAKAGLAHTRLKIEENKLDADKAIDTLERLRYSWRGDELETQVNYWLGRTYFEGDSFLKGLRIMRDSAEMAPTPEYALSILEEMGEVFSNLYLGEKLKDIKALDAVALYEQFSELLPTGERGDQIIEKLSRYLVNANLLTRAAALLEHQIDHRLDDEGSVQVGLRLATIRLLDDNQERALKTLDVVESKLAALPPDYPKAPIAHEVTMLRIRALSEMDEPDRALELLENLERSPEVNRLRADVAWNARYWDDAADALKDVIADEKISLTRPLSPEQATLILNRAIALNLDGDRIAISNVREKYAMLMEQTEQSRIFEVITRARQSAKLADRETLLSSISEVDLFKDFMESYNKTLDSEEE